MELPFYASIKLTTGEEILTEITRTEEHGVEFFILDNPIVVQETNDIDVDKGISMNGLIPRKWMTYAGDELIILYRQHIITMVELDKFSQEFYKNALAIAKMSSPIKRKIKTEDHSGYLGSIDECREYLEGLYNKSNESSKDEI